MPPTAIHVVMRAGEGRESEAGLRGGGVEVTSAP